MSIAQELLGAGEGNERNERASALLRRDREMEKAGSLS